MCGGEGGTAGPARGAHILRMLPATLVPPLARICSCGCGGVNKRAHTHTHTHTHTASLAQALVVLLLGDDLPPHVLAAGVGVVQRHKAEPREAPVAHLQACAGRQACAGMRGCLARGRETTRHSVCTHLARSPPGQTQNSSSSPPAPPRLLTYASAHTRCSESVLSASGEMWMATALGGRKGHSAMAEPCTMTRMLTLPMMRSWSGKGTSCTQGGARASAHCRGTKEGAR